MPDATTTHSGRLPSLDILRGATVAMMILVNNPGSWSSVFGCLSHSAWDGCTPTDLVFPFFLFIVGASIRFAFRRYDWRLTRRTAAKILRRGAAIWIVGIAISKFPYYDFIAGEWSSWHDVRIMGVLPRIALCYSIGALLCLGLRSARRIALAALLLAAAYQTLVYALGDATLEGYFGSALDNALLGESHLYHGYRDAAGARVAFDPEGLAGTMTATVNVMLGYLAAMCMAGGSDGRLRMAAWGGTAIVAALALDSDKQTHMVGIICALHLRHSGGVVVLGIPADRPRRRRGQSRKHLPCIRLQCPLRIRALDTYREDRGTDARMERGARRARFALFALVGDARRGDHSPDRVAVGRTVARRALLGGYVAAV